MERRCKQTESGFDRWVIARCITAADLQNIHLWAFNEDDFWLGELVTFYKTESQSARQTGIINGRS